MAMGAPTRDRQVRWQRHLVGVLLGLVVVAAIVGHARLVHELETLAARGFVLWPHRLLVGLPFLWGVVLAVVVGLAPRYPALPTVVAATLVYGAFASLPLLPRLLPLLGEWQPRMATVMGLESGYRWQGDVLLVVAGTMTAAAVWGWWRVASAGRPAHDPPRDEPDGQAADRDQPRRAVDRADRTPQ